MKDTKQIFTQLSTCVANIASKAWSERYSDLVATLGGDQVMVFHYSTDGASCLLSRNFRSMKTAAELSEAYIGGWYKRDPMYHALSKFRDGRIEVMHATAYQNGFSNDYWQKFYAEPKLTQKSAILAHAKGLRLIVNIYSSDPDAMQHDDSLLLLLGQLAIEHFTRFRNDGTPSVLSVLTQREAQVCQGILLGKKGELIADDLGVSVTTVATYRQRAYRKLGISSKGALFALCR